MRLVYAARGGEGQGRGWGLHGEVSAAADGSGGVSGGGGVDDGSGRGGCNGDCDSNARGEGGGLKHKKWILNSLKDSN
jgi:hypothetical protein